MTTTDQQLPDLDQQETRTAVSHRSQVTLADGTTFVVRVTNRDRVAWDMTAPRHKWGRAQDVPFLAQTFVTFAAAKREGAFTGTFDAFRDSCEEIEDLPVDDEADVIRPTTKAPGPAPS